MNLSDATWQILFADDDQEFCDQVTEYLEGLDSKTTDGVAFAVTTLRVTEY